MLNIRLPRELEAKLDLIAKQEKITKSTIVREALQEYILDYEKTRHPYELGIDLFGKYGSGTRTLSTEYKKKVKEKIHAKLSD